MNCARTNAFLLMKSHHLEMVLDIGKFQQEIILACPTVGMLLLFGLGLSDATQQDTVPEGSIGQQPCERPPYTLDTVKSGITRHAIKTCQIEQRLLLLQE